MATVVGCSATAGVEDGDLVLAGRGTLAGFVAIGPICPVEQEGVPCPVPPEVYAGVDVVVREEANGELAARVDLDDEGRYRVDLPAGRYRVRLDHELGIDRGFSPTHDVEIRAGRTTELDFDIDTGIR
ncbi:MAG TPA: carboxypeptidase-like regulatory domain-containing protein [Gemmatimonadota bacterium]|nr:carboxypeptidase-like regulatory domain-containing protein [Gemmatimonadota bacterium]